MDYESLQQLRQLHPAWRLLMADHAPMVASFLHAAFIKSNTRTLARQEMVSLLDDHLFRLRDRHGAEAWPRISAQYLDDWASDEKGWLRKYYPSGSDEPHYDLTSATEKALEWIASLRERRFIGTESRMQTVFELLRQLTSGTDDDPRVRLAELERRRAILDTEIAEVKAGRVELLDAAQVKDRFLQMEANARDLLSDFREVEQNFRNLDRSLREQITAWDGSKGALLQQLFGQRDAISDSDQGRSFQAFWDFLMSPARQEELSQLLDAVLALDAVRDLEPDPRLRRIHYDWLEAGEVAQRTVARLSAQLRRFLDDQALLENRRIVDLIREIEQRALSLKDAPPERDVAFIDALAPEIELPLDRPLFKTAFKPHIAPRLVVDGVADISSEALFQQIYVDKERLRGGIRRALQLREHISLADLLELDPLQQGLAEVVTYLSIASEDRDAVFDDGRRQTVRWEDAEGSPRQATVPLVIFCRRAKERGAA